LRLKDNFEPQVSFDQGKLLAQGTLHTFLSLPWLGMETYGSKIYFYCNIFYRNIVRQNVLCESGLCLKRFPLHCSLMTDICVLQKGSNRV